MNRSAAFQRLEIQHTLGDVNCRVDPEMQTWMVDINCSECGAGYTEFLLHWVGLLAADYPQHCIACDVLAERPVTELLV